MKAMHRWTSVFTTIGLLCVAATLGSLYLHRNSKDENAPKYTVARVTRGDVVQSVDAVGQLSPLVSVEVSSQISGLVTEVFVEFNSVVKAGQVLARIDPSTFEQRLRQARADLEATKATTDLAALNTHRLKGLRDEELISQQDYDESLARLEAARATLITRQAALENARVDLERCTLRSPIDGIVIFKQIEVGKTVVSSLSAPTLFTIARDLSKMRIVAPISEVDVGFVRPGQLATFTIDAFPDRMFDGRLTQVRNPYTPSDSKSTQDPQQSSVASFDAIIEVENGSGLLRPSLTANVSIVVNQSLNTLRVPKSALRFRPASEDKGTLERHADGGTSVATVFLLPADNDSIEPQAVKVRVGIGNQGMTEIIQGLSEGQSVVTGVLPANNSPRHSSSLF